MSTTSKATSSSRSSFFSFGSTAMAARRKQQYAGSAGRACMYSEKRGDPLLETDALEKRGYRSIIAG